MDMQKKLNQEMGQVTLDLGKIQEIMLGIEVTAVKLRRAINEGELETAGGDAINRDISEDHRGVQKIVLPCGAWAVSAPMRGPYSSEWTYNYLSPSCQERECEALNWQKGVDRVKRPIGCPLKF
jgi:hypothetical protein